MMFAHDVSSVDESVRLSVVQRDLNAAQMWSQLQKACPNEGLKPHEAQSCQRQKFSPPYSSF